MGACAQIAVFTFAYATNALLCLYSVAAWAQEIGTSFSVPFFRLSVGTDDRSKLLCALKPRFGALHTRFDDYTPRNENYRGLIDKI